MNDKEKIEELLKNYRSIRSNIEIELNRDYPEYSLDSVSFVKTGDETNEIHSSVENYVVDKHSLDNETIQKIQVVEIIRAAYEGLPEELKKVIADLYFEDRRVKTTAAGWGYSEETIRRRKNRAIGKLKQAGILEAWGLWEEVMV